MTRFWSVYLLLTRAAWIVVSFWAFFKLGYRYHTVKDDWPMSIVLANSAVYMGTMLADFARAAQMVWRTSRHTGNSQP